MNKYGYSLQLNHLQIHIKFEKENRIMYFNIKY